MARVELSGVSKLYPGGVQAVKPLDLVVEDGELVVLVGPSGSGKTTILRLVAGLEQATSGAIRIGQRDVTGQQPRQRDVAYVPQSCPLYPHLRVIDNLAFGGRVRHGSILTRWWRRFAQPNKVANSQPRAIEIARVRQAADRLGIGHLLERWPRQLSGGERQRVALGRALLREPAAFLFDEPLASLDPALRSQLRTEIKQLHRQVGRATVYVTHDQAEALALADRMVVLRQGEVQQIGSPDDVYDRPANRFVAQFVGGAPAMNLLPGKIEERSGQWFFAGEDWQFELDALLATELVRQASEVELGLRPEAIEIVEAADAGGAVQARVQESLRLGDSREIALAPVVEDRNSQGKKASLCLAKVCANSRWRSGDIVGWRPRWSSSHWFDRHTGQRIAIVRKTARDITT